MPLELGPANPMAKDVAGLANVSDGILLQASEDQSLQQPTRRREPHVISALPM